MSNEEVRVWLENRLRPRYDVRCSVVRLDAAAAGITKGQLTQARAQLKVKTINLKGRFGKLSGEHAWVLR